MREKLRAAAARFSRHYKQKEGRQQLSVRIAIPTVIELFMPRDTPFVLAYAGAGPVEYAATDHDPNILLFDVEMFRVTFLQFENW